MIDPLIPERLKNAREKLGITRAEASRRLNLSKIGYSRYEYGERVPSPQTVEAIAICFHTSVAYLTGATDDMSPDYFVVDKNKNPDLFALVELCNTADHCTLNRLLTYCLKLTKKSGQ